MALPKQSDIELPLLRALLQLGGEARPRDVYRLVEREFPEITAADLAETLLDGGSKWTNRIQWARQNLRALGQLETSGRGVWKISPAGRARVAAAENERSPSLASAPPDLEAVWGAYESAFRDQTLERLQLLSSEQFERFGREFLRAYGFVDLEVTQTGPDGGIDGHGRLRVGVTTMRVAFQCKKWKGPVGRPEVDKFRGAIQGEFEQGLFFTTSRFAKPAQDVSIKKGAVPVILIDGPQIVEIMIEKGVGVAKRPLYLYEKVKLPGVEESDE